MRTAYLGCGLPSGWAVEEFGGREALGLDGRLLQIRQSSFQRRLEVMPIPALRRPIQFFDGCRKFPGENGASSFVPSALKPLARKDVHKAVGVPCDGSLDVEKALRE